MKLPLQLADMGLSIGCFYLGTPTCADDILLLSRCPYELQSMVTINEAYSKKNRYEIHADPDPLISKSRITPCSYLLSTSLLRTAGRFTVYSCLAQKSSSISVLTGNRVNFPQASKPR